MGIPAAFRWLSKKYPAIISPVIEDQPITMDDGNVIPVDATRPNPNGEEFDNLYLDMNGIVHPCSHPEDKPAPKDEEEMMVEIFKYTDRVVNMVRPRKILMIAVDGVAPRAKMNQQRSRRFRSAQDAKLKEEDKARLVELLKQQNGGVLKPESAEVIAKKAFDSNSITPGTPFMDILAASLRYWCSYKLNSDPAWAKLKVIISDATVPGEGEHKIMEFVRSQRGSPDHDPNTRHVIYGLDADLIMLGLATHEPHFRVLREDVFFDAGKARICGLCGQGGHDTEFCKADGRNPEKEQPLILKPFIWLHVSVLREYLAVELDVPGLPFEFDLERAIDDWVFLCFFVGNDFLPHLPALEIREHGLDTLTAIWRDNLPHMGGYVTKDGHMNLDRAQRILQGLAKQEDSIFRRRKESEDRREAGFKRRKLQQEQREQRNGNNKSRNSKAKPDYFPAGLELHPIADFPTKYGTPAVVTHDQVVSRRGIDRVTLANKSAASELKSRQAALSAQSEATPGKDESPKAKEDTDMDKEEPRTPASALGKRKASIMEEDSASTPGASEPSTPSAAEEEGPVDSVRLWEEGYADRYYEQKFHVDPADFAFRHKVARAYAEGLAWVLMYYFQGCPSWEWYYPYHYAPFAADFVDISKMEIKFTKGRISRPFEQLMSVLPAASRHAIPEVFHDLMTNEDSNIIDFYPEDFVVDLNGKKMAWQGIALLPFIDMPRLLTAMDTKYPELSAEDHARNRVGRDVLLLSDGHPTLYDEITSHFYSKKQVATTLKLNPRLSDGLAGTIEKIEGYVPHGSLVYPLSRNTMPDVDYDRSLSVYYDFPKSAHGHKSMLLRGVKLPKPALGSKEIQLLKSKGNNSGRSYGGVPLEGNRPGDRGGRGGSIYYGPNGTQPPSYGRQDRGRGPYQGSSNGYNANRYNNNYNAQSTYGPPPGWQPPVPPPPPGSSHFGIGMPPPPPPANLGYRDNRYGNSSGHGNGYGYRQQDQGYQNRYAPPFPPPPAHSPSNYYPPAPPAPGQDRNYNQRPYGNDPDRNNRGYRGPR